MSIENSKEYKDHSVQDAPDFKNLLEDHDKGAFAEDAAQYLGKPNPSAVKNAAYDAPGEGPLNSKPKKPFHPGEGPEKDKSQYKAEPPSGYGENTEDADEPVFTGAAGSQALREKSAEKKQDDEWSDEARAKAAEARKGGGKPYSKNPGAPKGRPDLPTGRKKASPGEGNPGPYHPKHNPLGWGDPR